MIRFCLVVLSALLIMLNPFRVSAATYSEFFISGYDYFHSELYTEIELEFHDVKFDSS